MQADEIKMDKIRTKIDEKQKSSLDEDEFERNLPESGKNIRNRRKGTMKDPDVKKHLGRASSATPAKRKQRQ